MQHSDQPYNELERAHKSIESMRTAQSLEDLDEHWKEFLRRLERVWNKSENHFRKSPKWDSWSGKFKTLRKKDPLLSYLTNARGADEHTIAEITERQAGHFSIDAPASGGAVYIKHLQTDDLGRIVKYDVRGDHVVNFRPAQVKLLPVTNRGIVHDAPTEHLSHPIDPNHLVDVAERGVAFYADFLKQAEVYFIESVRSNR